MSFRSPITGSVNTSLVHKIPTKIIIEKYQQLNIDVSRFFTQCEEIEMHQCNDSLYRFYYPFNIFGDGKFYEELQAKAPGYYIEGRWEHFKALNFINKNERVLEVGCGDGFFLDLLRKKNIGSVGLELNSKAAEDARKKGLTVYTQLLEEHSNAHANQYDVVCSYQVLEHISEPHSFLSDCLKAIKPGGKIIIAVPNNNPYIFKHDLFHTLNLPPHHAGLWNKEAFENLQKFFPVKLISTNIEPLTEYKEWFQAQVKYLKEKKSIWGNLLSLVPRPLYKVVLRAFRNSIEGRNILVVFTKIS